MIEAAEEIINESPESVFSTGSEGSSSSFTFREEERRVRYEYVFVTTVSIGTSQG